MSLDHVTLYVCDIIWFYNVCNDICYKLLLKVGKMSVGQLKYRPQKEMKKVNFY